MSNIISSRWFVRAHAAPDAAIRLLCFPHAGGGASAYHRWGKQLPAEVLAVQMPGRENRLREPPIHNLVTMAAAVVDAMQIDPLLTETSRPCALFGHSMGALLAYETARELQRRNQSLPLALFVSGRAPPDHIEGESPLHTLPDAQFIEELDRRFDGLPAVLREEPELMELFLPVLRADITMLEQHEHQPGTSLPLPIYAFGGREDLRAQHEHLQDWARFSSQWRGLRQFPGGHFYLHNAYSTLPAVLAAELAQLEIAPTELLVAE